MLCACWLPTLVFYAEIYNILGGSTPSRAEPRYFGGNIVWLTPTEIPKGTVSIISNSREKLTEDGFNESGVRWIPKGSILLTSRASIGYVAIAGTQLTTNQGFASFVLPNGIEPKYFGWWLKSQKDLLENLAGGTTFKEISKATLKEVYAPIAPTNEQQRIVLAIEERFTILDAVTTTLQQNKQKLKLARASVLKHAVEGKLTEKWRAEHPATESGQQLLERILAERRAKWEAEQLAKMRTKSVVPRDDKWKLGYKGPAEPDTEDLFSLPREWSWTPLEAIASIQLGKMLSPKAYEVGLIQLPYLRNENVRWGSIDYSDVKEMGFKNYELEKYRLKPNDLLVCEGGEAGRCAIYTADPGKYMYQKALHRVRVIGDIVKPRFIQFSLQYYVSSKVVVPKPSETTIQHLPLEKMQILPFPLPPLAEQQQIVAEVERHLSVIEQAEVAIETSLKRIERARQSILVQAFSGRLVPQDPHDEPASVLLERIQQERTRRVVEGKRRGSNGGVKVARGKKAKAQEFVPQWQLLKEAQPSELLDGLLSSVSAHENGAAEKGDVEQDEIGKEALGDLVQMPLLWD